MNSIGIFERIKKSAPQLRSIGVKVMPTCQEKILVVIFPEDMKVEWHMPEVRHNEVLCSINSPLIVTEDGHFWFEDSGVPTWNHDSKSGYYITFNSQPLRI